MAATVSEAGLPHAYGKRLARLSWARYGRLRRLDPVYFSSACHRGSRLDLTPRTPSWPTG